MNGVVECKTCGSKARQVSVAYDRQRSIKQSKWKARNVLLVLGDCTLIALQVRSQIDFPGFRCRFGKSSHMLLLLQSSSPSLLLLLRLLIIFIIQVWFTHRKHLRFRRLVLRFLLPHKFNLICISALKLG